MIGHLHIRMQQAARAFAGLAQPFSIGKVVLIGEEAGLTIVAALNDVQWMTGKM